MEKLLFKLAIAAVGGVATYFCVKAGTNDANLAIAAGYIVFFLS